jgi:hypothetical protein
MGEQIDTPPQYEKNRNGRSQQEQAALDLAREELPQARHQEREQTCNGSENPA